MGMTWRTWAWAVAAAVGAAAAASGATAEPAPGVGLRFVTLTSADPSCVPVSGGARVWLAEPIQGGARSVEQFGGPRPGVPGVVVPIVDTMSEIPAARVVSLEPLLVRFPDGSIAYEGFRPFEPPAGRTLAQVNAYGETTYVFVRTPDGCRVAE